MLDLRMQVIYRTAYNWFKKWNEVFENTEGDKSEIWKTLVCEMNQFPEEIKSLESAYIKIYSQMITTNIDFLEIKYSQKE